MSTAEPLQPAWRPIILGCTIGVTLAIANLYMGLKTGLWDSGSITAAILGMAALRSVLPPDYQRIEEEQSGLFADGMPRKQQFTLEFQRYGEDYQNI